MKVWRVLPVCLALLAACSAPPKPRELESFERLRADPRTRMAAQVAPGILKQADNLMREARNSWESNDLDDARHLALLGEAKVKHAIALAEQADAEKRNKHARTELNKAQAEIDKLERELDATKESLGLLQRIEREKREQARLQAEMERQKRFAEEQLQGEKARGEATEKVKAAEVSVKEAEGVQAQTHAKESYAAAVELLARARTQLDAGELDEARLSADLARQKAVAATEQAKPIHEQTTREAQRTARAESLNRDAAAISMIEVRRETRGVLQRVVLHVPASSLFRNTRDTALAAGSEGILGSIAELIKKYEDFPVQIVGHTDSRGRQDALLARSLARANSVYNALLGSGIPTSRFTVLGRGGEEPLSDNRTRSGRERNSRIEIVFMYQ